MKVIVVFFLAYISAYAFSHSIADLQKACDINNSGVDCLFASIYLKDGNETSKPDLKKSIYYLHKACDLNVSVACYNLGNFYAKVLHDNTTALKLYDKACKRDFKNACYNYHILNGDI